MSSLTGRRRRRLLSRLRYTNIINSSSNRRQIAAAAARRRRRQPQVSCRRCSVLSSDELARDTVVDMSVTSSSSRDVTTMTSLLTVAVMVMTCVLRHDLVDAITLAPVSWNRSNPMSVYTRRLSTSTSTLLGSVWPRPSQYTDDVGLQTLRTRPDSHRFVIFQILRSLNISDVFFSLVWKFSRFSKRFVNIY